MDILTTDAIIAMLFSAGALQFGKYKRLKCHSLYPEMPESFFYASIRKEILDPVLLMAIGRYMASCCHELQLYLGQKWSIVGVPNGGIELAEGYVDFFQPLRKDDAVSLEIPLTKDGEGDTRHIVITPRTLLPERPICLIENTMTTAASLVEATTALRRYGGDVKKAVVLLDRQLGGMEKLAELGVEAESCFTITQLINYLRSVGLISDEVARRALLNLQEMQLYLKQHS